MSQVLQKNETDNKIKLLSLIYRFKILVSWNILLRANEVSD